MLCGLTSLKAYVSASPVQTESVLLQIVTGLRATQQVTLR